MYMQNTTAFTEYERVILAEEVGAKQAFSRTGFVAGTMVETTAGWRPVENLTVGDRVATYDGGYARVTAISHGFTASGQRAGMLVVPGGALNNCADLRLMDDQLLMIDGYESEKLLGESAVLLPAAALDGFRGIRRIDVAERVEVINLRLEDEEIVYANTGVMFYCASGRVSGHFTRLSIAQARTLLSLMDRDLGFLRADTAALAA